MYRRVCALSLLYVLSLQSTARAQDAASPLVISERVGAEIDQEERAYFGLFPDVEGFLSATAHRSNGNGAVFHITRLQGSIRSDTAIVVEPEVVLELRRYIDRFERLYQNTPAVAWELLQQVAKPVKPFREGAKLEVTQRDGTPISGRLLYIDEQVLVLSTARNLLERPVNMEEAFVLFPHEFNCIRDTWPFHKRIAEEIIIVGAGDKGIYQSYTLPKLRKRAVLRSVPSPELNALMQAALEKHRSLQEKEVPSVPVHGSYLQRFTSKLHLSFSIYPLPPQRRFPAYEVVVLQGVQRKAIAFSHPLFSLRMAYRFTGRMRLGGGLRYTPGLRRMAPYVQSFRVEDQHQLAQALAHHARTPGRMRISGHSVSGLFIFILKPFDPFSYLQGTPTRTPLEFRVAAGLSYAMLSVDSEVNLGRKLTDASFLLINKTSTDRQKVLGTAGSLEADYYFTRYLSVGIAAHLSYYPEVHIQGHEFSDMWEGSYSSKTIQAFTDSLAVTELALGIRLHL